MCDRVGVLYAGEMVEEGPARRGVRPASPPVHGRAAPLHPTSRPAQGRRHAGHHSRIPARPRLDAHGLHLRRALRDCRRTAATTNRRPCTRWPPVASHAAISTSVRRDLPRVIPADDGHRCRRRGGRAVAARRRPGQDVSVSGVDVHALAGVSLRHPAPARRWGWSASRAAARRRSARALWGSIEPDTGAYALARRRTAGRRHQEAHR